MIMGSGEASFNEKDKNQKCLKAKHLTMLTSDIASLQRYSRSVSCTVGGGVGAIEHAN